MNGALPRPARLIALPELCEIAIATLLRQGNFTSKMDAPFLKT